MCSGAGSLFVCGPRYGPLVRERPRTRAAETRFHGFHPGFNPISTGTNGGSGPSCSFKLAETDEHFTLGSEHGQHDLRGLPFDLLYAHRVVLKPVTVEGRLAPDGERPARVHAGTVWNRDATEFQNGVDGFGPDLGWNPTEPDDGLNDPQVEKVMPLGLALKGDENVAVQERARALTGLAG